MKELKDYQAEQKIIIKRDNKKAGAIFIVVMLAAALIGGVLGILSEVLKQEQTDIKQFLGTFMDENSVGIGIAFTVLVVGVSVAACIYSMLTLRYGRKRAMELIDTDEEDILGRLEKKLDYMTWMSSLLYILYYFYISALLFMSHNNKNENFKWITLLSAIITIVGILAATVLQQKIIDLERLLNPEKKGSVYDLKFQKKWEESCDEAQKYAIYRASYHAMKAVNMLCIVLWVLFIVIGMITRSGFQSVIAVLVIWAVSVSVYCHYSIKYSNDAGGR